MRLEGMVIKTILLSLIKQSKPAWKKYGREVLLKMKESKYSYFSCKSLFLSSRIAIYTKLKLYVAK